ncbi:uncharacterized protein TNCV_4440321 [Trichonephila clavipes]|nr:uncharacterized protein TNCV_4440321 [Trichonephila clavipes]
MEPSSLLAGEVLNRLRIFTLRLTVELTGYHCSRRKQKPTSDINKALTGELREHHSNSHQVIKVVVFQLPTPTGLSLCMRSALRSVYVANRCSGISPQGSRSSRCTAWRVGCHLSRPPSSLN